LQYDVSISNWGNSTAGTIDVSDNCGGRFGTSYQRTDLIAGNWLPPVQAGVCIIRARAVNGDGVAATLSVAVLVHEGTPRTASPPQFQMNLYGPTNCSLSSTNSPVTCPPVTPGAVLNTNGNVNWLDGLPGSVSVTDDCGGTFTRSSSDTSRIYGTWSSPAPSGTTCTLTVQVTNLEGVTSQAVGTIPLL
jgi:hypothetical protein